MSLVQVTTAKFISTTAMSCLEDRISQLSFPTFNLHTLSVLPSVIYSLGFGAFLFLRWSHSVVQANLELCST